MSGYIVVRDDGDTLVLKRIPDGDGCGWLLFIVIVILILKFSQEPSESDLAKEKYLEKAENFVEEYVVSWQGKNWEGWGWQPSSITNFREPEYYVEIANWKTGDFKDISNRVNYLGNGLYKVTVITNTHLKAKKGNRAMVKETFVFKIKRKPNDKYDVLEVEKTDMNPSQENFEEMLRSWTKSRI